MTPDRSPRWPWGATAEAAILTVVALLVVIAIRHSGPCLPDEVDYWQLGASLASGKGFETRMIRPLELRLHPTSLFTDVTRPPLMPALVALQRVVTHGAWLDWNPIGTLALALLALVQWSLARYLAGPWAGRVAWAMTMGNPHLLAYGSLLLSEMPFCLFTLLAVRAASGQRSSLSAAASGLWLACALLTRAVGMLYLPVVAGAFLVNKVRVRPWITGIAAVVATLGLWLWWCWRTTGLPFLGLNSHQLPAFTATWPGYSLFRTLHLVDPVRFALTHPGDLVAKWTQGVVLGGRSLVGHAGPGAAVAFLSTPLWVRSARIRRLWCISLAVTAAFLLALPFYEPRTRHYIPLLAWMIPVVAATCAELIASGRARRIVGVAILVLTAWAAWHDRNVFAALQPIAWDPAAAATLNSLPDSTIIATDAPWVVTIASRHRSLWIPQDTATWDACRQMLPHLRAVYLTRGLLSWSSDQRPGLWTRAYAGGELEGFPRALTFADGSRLWVQADRE